MLFFSFALNQSYKKSPLLFTASKNLRTFTFYTRLNKELLFKETISNLKIAILDEIFNLSGVSFFLHTTQFESSTLYYKL